MNLSVSPRIYTSIVKSSALCGFSNPTTAAGQMSLIALLWATRNPIGTIVQYESNLNQPLFVDLGVLPAPTKRTIYTLARYHKLYETPYLDGLLSGVWRAFVIRHPEITVPPLQETR